MALWATAGPGLHGARHAVAAFPGANGKIAFNSDRDGTREVWVMNADGSGQTNLSNSGYYDDDPAWSPDGSKIAFHSDRDLGEDMSEIYVMNADGSGQTNLTNNAAYDTSPDWQPLAVAVGGLAELPDVAASSTPNYIALAALAAAALLALSAGGWYARRRWLR